MQQTVIEAIHERTQTEATAETHLINDLGLDSLDRVELALTLEETMGILIPDDLMETAFFGTVADLASALENLRA